MNRKFRFISIIAVFLFAFTLALVVANKFNANPVRAAQKTVTVTYDPNGGELGNVPETQTATTNSSTVTIRLNSNKPTHADTYTISGCKKTTTKYTFYRWNTNAAGTGTNYSAGGSISRYRVSKGDLTLYARWNTSNSTSYVCSYRLTYDANGGNENQLPADQTSVNQSSTTKTFNVSTNTISRNPDYIGCHKIVYTFKGWSTNKDSYQAATSVKLTGVGGEEVVGTVYAFFDQEDVGLCSYKVNFDPNHSNDVITHEEDDNIIADSKTFIAKDLNVIKSADFVLCSQFNHRFLGWALEPDAVAPIYEAADEIIIEGEADELVELTLYAVWSNDEVGLCNYKVVYMYEDEQVDMEEFESVTSNSMEFALSSYVPYKEGYMFIGWDYDEDAISPLFNLNYNIVYLEYEDNYDVEMVLYPIYKQFDNVMRELIIDTAVIKTTEDNRFAPGYNFGEKIDEINKIKSSGYDLLQWVSVSYNSLNVEFVSEETFLGYGYTEVNINSEEFNNVIQSALGQAGERQMVYRFCSSISGLCSSIAATDAISVDLINNMATDDEFVSLSAVTAPAPVLMAEEIKTHNYSSAIFVITIIVTVIAAACILALSPSKKRSIK